MTVSRSQLLRSLVMSHPAACRRIVEIAGGTKDVEKVRSVLSSHERLFNIVCKAARTTRAELQFTLSKARPDNQGENLASYNDAWTVIHMAAIGRS